MEMAGGNGGTEHRREEWSWEGGGAAPTVLGRSH